MIIDYRNNKEFALANGVTEENRIGETWFSGDDVVSGVTFRNFNHLCVDDVIFVDCVFEDCQNVTFDGCHIKNCSFRGLANVDGVRTYFSDCVFKECCSHGPFLCIDSNGQIKGCRFETITALGDDGYVISSVYGKKRDVKDIIGTTFIGCQVESEDGELCYCSFFKPLSSFRTEEVDNLDYSSCVFTSCGAIAREE